MKTHPTLRALLSMVLLVVSTGCFRVGSETRALRDAALDTGLSGSEERIEIGVGFFTVGLAKLAGKFIELPPEARVALDSVRGAECSVYEFKQRSESLASILAKADQAMERRGCDRLVGVIHEDQLVAVYVPRDCTSAYDLKASVLVIHEKQLVCASARADATDLIQLAMSKIEQKIPPRVAGNYARRQ